MDSLTQNPTQTPAGLLLAIKSYLAELFPNARCQYKAATYERNMSLIMPADSLNSDELITLAGLAKENPEFQFFVGRGGRGLRLHITEKKG